MAFSIKVGLMETRRFWSKKQMIDVIASEAGIMEADAGIARKSC